MKNKNKCKKNKKEFNYKIEKVTVSSVVHSTEDAEKVGEAIATLFPFEFEINVSKAKGHYGNEILLLEVEIKNSKKIYDFLSYLFNHLNESKLIFNTLDERVDEGNVLHIRIDKQKAYLGELHLSTKDAISIKIKMVTYPSRKELAIRAFKDFISNKLKIY